jgi:hypothetical protein
MLDIEFKLMLGKDKKKKGSKTLHGPFFVTRYVRLSTSEAGCRVTGRVSPVEDIYKGWFTYIEARGCSPLATLSAINTGLRDLTTSKKIGINVSLPRHDESVKEKTVDGR